MKKQVFTFLCVGGLGFALDAGLTQGFVSLAHVNPYYARIPAMLIAIVTTFFLNKHHTFDARDHCPWRSFGMYAISTTIAQGLNYGIYFALLSMSKHFHAYPFFAVVAGSACAAFVSFLLSKYWVFKK